MFNTHKLMMHNLQELHVLHSCHRHVQQAQVQQTFYELHLCEETTFVYVKEIKNISHAIHIDRIQNARRQNVQRHAVHFIMCQKPTAIGVKLLKESDQRWQGLSVDTYITDLQEVL